MQGIPESGWPGKRLLPIKTSIVSHHASAGEWSVCGHIVQGATERTENRLVEIFHIVKQCKKPLICQLVSHSKTSLPASRISDYRPMYITVLQSIKQISQRIFQVIKIAKPDSKTKFF
jgi:hypothetical protein